MKATAVAIGAATRESDGLLSHRRLLVDLAQVERGSARLFGGHVARSSYSPFILDYLRVTWKFLNGHIA